MELLPVIYLFVCYITASSLGSIRVIGTWLSFFLAVFLSPPLAALVIVMFPKISKAYCMKDYEVFETGKWYHYKVCMNANKKIMVSVFNGDQYDLERGLFNQHFSVVKDF